MDLSTTYLGKKLKNPLVPSASPLSRDHSSVKLMEDSGAGAVVLESLFEEQIIHEKNEMDHFLSQGTDSFAESLSYFPESDMYNFGPDEYLEHIQQKRCSAAVCRELVIYRIIPEKCTGCQSCVKVCPTNAISGPRSEPHNLDEEKCIKCRACYEICRFDAIAGDAIRIVSGDEEVEAPAY